MSDETKTKDARKDGLGSKGAMIAAVAVVIGGLGIAIGRWSSHESPSATETTPLAAPSGSASGTGSASPPPGAVGATASGSPSPLGSAAGPQIFDTVEDPNWKAGVPMRDMDRDIFAQMKNENLDRNLLTDLFPDRPYKVRLVGSVSEHRFGLVMIDLTRDGKWDERWDLRAGQVVRNVEHDEGADGQPVKYTLTHGKWQPH